MATEVSPVSGANDTGQPSKATPTATVDAIAETLVTEKPDVQEHAIAQAKADAAAAIGKDKEGNSFNPAIHAVDSDGKPRLRANGSYALKRGKKAGSAQTTTKSQTTQSNKGISVPGTTPAKDAKAQESRAAGVGAANLMFALMQGTMGPEWAPRVDEKIGVNEKLMMETAHADLFEAYGWGDLPPGLALVAAYCMFALPRLRMPQTQTRMQRIKIWIGTKFANWRADRSGKKRGVPESDVERADRESRELYRKEKENGATVRQN